MTLPIGHSAMPASFKCAHAKGMPTMVTAQRIAVTTWPSANHQPASTNHNDIADDPERSGAEVFPAKIFVARNGLLAERQQRVGRDGERGPRPGQSNNRDRHEDARDGPADRHP